MTAGPRGQSDIVIVGAGLTGLATAIKMGSGFQLYEAESQPGGLARTDQVQGFYFDRTGHWFHARTE